MTNAPVLANIALNGIEEILDKKYHLTKYGNLNRNKAAKSKVNFIRYADDFIVTAKTREIAEEVKEVIQEFLKERGLELSKDKTIITNINEGFDFLGWNFRKYKNKDKYPLLIKPAKKSIQKIIQKIRNIIKDGHTLPQETLIKKLNPVIIGWTNYHQGIVSKRIFSKIDAIIWNILWKWAKRRHPKKSHTWIARKYWHKMDNKTWIFHTEKAKLSYLREKKIVRTTPIKLEKKSLLRQRLLDKI